MIYNIDNKLRNKEIYFAFATTTTTITTTTNNNMQMTAL
jgi:hypothetical protein